MKGLRHAMLLVAVVGVGAHRVHGQDVDPARVLEVPVGVPPREGLASWYGIPFHGRLTACGEIYDQHELTAAHRTLPFGTRIAVTNLETGCRVMLRVNDRGPYHGSRILDCSRAGAEALGFVERGVTRIRWEVVEPAARLAVPPDPIPPRTVETQESLQLPCMEDAS